MSRIFNHLRRGFGENTRFAFLAVRTHKLRAFLTVLGIVVGVATVIAMVSIVTASHNMVRNFQDRRDARPFPEVRIALRPGHRRRRRRRKN